MAPHSQDLGLVQRSCARRDGEATPLPLGMFYSMAAGGKSRAEQTQESLMSDLAQATQGLSSHLHRHYFTKPLGFFLTGSHRQVAGSRGRLSPRAAFGRPEGTGQEWRAEEGLSLLTSLCSVRSPGCLLTNDSTSLGKIECPQTSV